MKRGRVDVEEGFNPVYPFGSDDNNNDSTVAPPFIASNGLQENPPGTLSLKIDKPLSFSRRGALTLSHDSTLTLTPSGLGLNAAQPPFNVTPEGGLQLSLVPPLTTTPAGLSLGTVAPPLQATDSGLQLNLRAPLTLEQGGGLGLATAAPLRTGDQGLSLQYSAPLRVTDQTLTLPLGRGLNTDTEGKLQVLVGSDSLSFSDSGALAPLALQTNLCRTPNASIRPPDETANYTKNARVFLSLCRQGPGVSGLIAVTGVFAPLAPLDPATTSSLRLHLPFLPDGSLATPVLEGWHGLSPKPALLPSTALYAPSTSSRTVPATNYQFFKTFLNGDQSQSCDLTLSLNVDAPDSGYALTFTWSNFSSDTAEETFATAPTHFFFIAEAAAD